MMLKKKHLINVLLTIISCKPMRCVQRENAGNNQKTPPDSGYCYISNHCYYSSQRKFDFA